MFKSILNRIGWRDGAVDLMMTDSKETLFFSAKTKVEQLINLTDDYGKVFGIQKHQMFHVDFTDN